MLQPYIPVLLVIAFVVANAILMLGLSHVLSSYRLTAVKLTPYESGMPVLGDARERFSVKFYLVALLFVLFDIEVVFLYPWAAYFQEPGRQVFLFAEMCVFAGILFFGWWYVVRKGAVDWAKE